MITVTSKLNKDGQYTNNIAYNATVKTMLGMQIVKNWYSINTEAPLTNEDVQDFNPQHWVIRQSKYISDTTGEELSTNWLDSEKVPA